MTGRYKAYPKYMTADSKWLDEIPAHWKVTALKHVLSTPITDGPHSTPIFQDEGIPFVSAEAVSGGYINFDKIRGYISEEDDTLFSQKYRPQLHDVYMIKSGATTGISAIVETNRRFNIWSPLAVMRCKKSYNPYFLLNYLRSDSFQKSVQLSWTFGTQQNIGMNTLENLTVCFPPFEEQQKIASFLDHETAKIDTLIAKQEKLIELLKEKRQAVISHAVTKGLNPDAPMTDSGVEWLGEVPEHWAVGSLRWRISISSGEGLPSTLVEKNSSELKQVPVIGGNGVMGFTETSNTNRTAIAIGRVGALCGNVHLINYVSWITDNALKISSWDGFDEYYLVNLLKAANLNDLASKTAQPLITGEQIKSLTVVIPPIEEQVNINLKLTEITNRFDKLEQKAVLGIELLKERKTTIISAAVTGKIDVRDWELK
ncbi:restriction endonuclease subunit S [Vibrio parahaemolyticus]|nr:restriction endonuclease subunit S [Vibrio parahaemolyticus]